MVTTSTRSVGHRAPHPAPRCCHRPAGFPQGVRVEILAWLRWVREASPLVGARPGRGRLSTSLGNEAIATVEDEPPRQTGWVTSVTDWALVRRLIAGHRSRRLPSAIRRDSKRAHTAPATNRLRWVATDRGLNLASALASRYRSITARPRIEAEPLTRTQPATARRHEPVRFDAHHASARRTVSANRAPTSLSTSSSVPPRERAISRAMGSPRPVPP